LSPTVLKAAVRAIAASNAAAVEACETTTIGHLVAGRAARRAAPIEVRAATETTGGTSWQGACASLTTHGVVNQAYAARGAASARRVLPAEFQAARAAVGEEEEDSAVRRLNETAPTLLPGSFAS
jgi:hypothetical protein